MVLRPLRKLAPAPEAVELYDDWLAEIEERLEDPACDRSELCVEILRDLFYPQIDPATDESRLPKTTRIALRNLDPRGVTLEPEYYDELEEELYYPRKPLIWLWQMFDRSPLGGNVHLDLAVADVRPLTLGGKRPSGRAIQTYDRPICP
jgi:hypothetical protein